VTIVEPTRAEPDAGVDYSAFYREQLTEADPRLTAMTAFARRIGTRLALCLDGRPFVGMECQLKLGVLTEPEAAEFAQLFSPDLESAIPLL
jgi:hypothetical protein